MGCKEIPVETLPCLSCPLINALANEYSAPLRSLKLQAGLPAIHTTEDMAKAVENARVGWVQQEEVERRVAVQEVEARVWAEKAEWADERDAAVRAVEARAAARVGWVEEGEAERRLEKRLEEERTRGREMEGLRAEMGSLRAELATAKAVAAVREEERGRERGMWERMVVAGGVRIAPERAEAHWKPEPANAWMKPARPLSSHRRFPSL